MTLLVFIMTRLADVERTSGQRASQSASPLLLINFMSKESKTY
jgi:hypothetical protein